MKAKSKQWCLLLSSLTGMLVGIGMLWRFQLYAAAKDEYFGEYDLLITGPLLAAAGGVLAISSAVVVGFLLSFVHTSSQSRSKSLSAFVTCVLVAAGFSVIAGGLISFTPIGWAYGIWVSGIQHRQAEARVERILNLPEKKAVSELQELIRQGSASAKIRAANELCQFGDKALVALDDMLDLVYGAYGTRLAGDQMGIYPNFILESGPKAALLIPRLTKALTAPPGIDRSEWQRLQLVEFSARVLGAIGPAAASAAKTLEEVAMSDPVPLNPISSEHARERCIYALKSIGVECDVFERLLESKYEDARYDAILILELQCPERLLTRLTNLADDPSPEVRQRSLFLLAHHMPAEAESTLISATEDEDLWTKVAAIQLLRSHFPELVTEEIVDSAATQLKYFLTGFTHSAKEIERALHALDNIDQDAAEEAADKLSKYEHYRETALRFLDRIDVRSASNSD